MLRAIVDTEEWDEMYGRVRRGLTPALMHLVASRAIAQNIRDTYDERWDHAMPEGVTGKYQVWKDWLGAGSQTGTLTGSSRRAITAEADDDLGKVFLAGNWPNMPETEPLQTEFGEGGDVRTKEAGDKASTQALFYDETGVPSESFRAAAEHFGKEFAKFTVESVPFSSITYGDDRKTGGPFTWFFATSDDISLAVGVIDDLIQFLLEPTRRLALGRLQDIFEITPGAESILDVGTRSPLDLLIEAEEDHEDF